MRSQHRKARSMLTTIPWGAILGAGSVASALLLAAAHRLDAQALLDARVSGPMPSVATLARSCAVLSGGAAIFLATIAARRQRYRAALVDNQADISAIKRLSWQDFELLVGEAYRRHGFRVDEIGQGGADGGVDLILSRDGRKVLVQCKRWAKSNLGAPAIREMAGLLMHHNAHEAKIVCASGFTKEVIKFAAGKPLELIDGDALLRLIAGVRKDTANGATTCLCGAPLTVRRGPSGSFLGCSRYPICRATKNLG